MLDPRRALQTTRYHTWPRIREQSVGEHSAQVQRILLAIWPNAPYNLLVHCLVHDIGECASGDPPYPVKKENPVLKQECDRIERDAHLAMCLPWQLPAPVTLEPGEVVAFKIAEFLEMYEWGLFELNLGNQYGHIVAERCEQAFWELLKLPELPKFVSNNAMRYFTRRNKSQKEIHNGHGSHVKVANSR